MRIEIFKFDNLNTRQQHNSHHLEVNILKFINQIVDLKD